MKFVPRIDTLRHGLYYGVVAQTVIRGSNHLVWTRRPNTLGNRWRQDDFDEIYCLNADGPASGH